MDTIDKYSSEWFYLQAQSDEWKKFGNEAEQARKTFLKEFGVEKIKAWKGKEILYNMFLNGVNKSNLCYMLEMQKDLRMFGGIGGGSSYKYGLFLYKKTGKWTTGSPIKPIVLTEQEALDLATEIRNYLVEGAEIIRNAGPLQSRTDYEKLYEKLSYIPNVNSVWVMKYYQMLFPDIFSVFYGKEIQLELLSFIKEAPSDIPLVRMGQIALFVKKCNIPSWIFGQIYYPISAENKGIKSKEPDILSERGINEIRYWIYSPGADACFWEEFYKKGCMAIGWGELKDLSSYKSKEDMRQKMKKIYDASSSYKNSALATWQFVHEIKQGDVILVKKGRNTILGKGIVQGDYEYVTNMPDDFNHCRKVNWKTKGTWALDISVPMKTLTDVSFDSEFISKINEIFSGNSDIEDEEPDIDFPVYTADKYLEEVYMDSEEYKKIVNLTRKKKNVILQGAPGVGKTFAAKRLAYSMIGKMDHRRVMMVQFHQSYSYEDFIMGYRPVNNGFELKKGAFYNFCKEAEKDKENEYFFIIDEINRGNLSKIFGELFMLIENDKRGIEMQLLYSDEKFFVPKNLYIIGMMNTADRSLAMMDYALRRRFAFIEMKPGFETDGFVNYQESLESEKFDRLVSCVKNMNKKIAADDSLGEGFCIGHSYFCNLNPEELDEVDLYNIVEFELIPLVKEYWFDEPAKVREWSDNLRSAIK